MEEAFVHSIPSADSSHSATPASSRTGAQPGEQAVPWRSGDLIDETKGTHAGETCYIVGKGPSLVDLTKEAFGPGPVICLNRAILHVQNLGLENKLYSMQKDGCESYHQRDVGCVGCDGEVFPIVYPEDSVTLLLHEHESRNCLPNHPRRLVFDAVDELGFDWWSTSSPCAIRIAKVFGCEKVVLLCHDSFFDDYRTANTANGSPRDLEEQGPGAVNYAPILQLVKQELAGISHEVVRPRADGGVDVLSELDGGEASSSDLRQHRPAPAYVPVYRFYNFKQGVHFYTASESEKAKLIETLAGTYEYEGVAYRVNVTNPSNCTSLYRFYDMRRGAHFYTASESEKANVIRTMSNIYRCEGVAYNVCASPVPNATPVYRFYNMSAGVHFYTASESEKANVIETLSDTYTYEGIAYYLAP
jgi:hypothetical protein